MNQLLAGKALPDGGAASNIGRVNVERQLSAVVSPLAVGRNRRHLLGCLRGPIRAQQLEIGPAVEVEQITAERIRVVTCLHRLQHRARRQVGTCLEHRRLGWCPWAQFRLAWIPQISQKGEISYKQASGIREECPICQW